MRTGGSGVKEDLFSKYILFIYFQEQTTRNIQKWSYQTTLVESVQPSLFFNTFGPVDPENLKRESFWCEKRIRNAKKKI